MGPCSVVLPACASRPDPGSGSGGGRRAGRLGGRADGCSGPEEQAICFASGLHSQLPTGYCATYGAAKVAALDCSNEWENTDHQIVS